MTLEELEAAARAGDAEAMRELGRRCAMGEGVEQDLCSAGEWFEKAAELGKAKDRWELARRFETGDGVPKNWEKAREWQDRALELEDTYEQCRFADRCLEGDGVPQDPERAIRWYQKAAERGETDAMLRLAEFFDEDEDGVPRDPERAVEWYREAAGQGDTDAMLRLAQLLDEGEGVEHDADEALEWYTRACNEGGNDAWPALRENLLARGEVVDEFACYCLLHHADGDEEAMLLAGQIFLQGYGVEYDEHEAVSWWEGAAEMGSVEAMERLAELYRTGHEVRDPKLAAKWKTRSLGRKWDEKAWHWSQMTGEKLFYDEDKANKGENADSPLDPALTVPYAVQEAEAGESGSIDRLRRLLEVNTAVPQNKALLLRCAALLGDSAGPRVLFKLGYTLAGLVRSQKGMAKAVDLLSASAEQEHAGALYVLSAFYHTGKGVPKDEEQSRRLRLRAALAGSPAARELLGVEYEFDERNPQSETFKRLWREVEMDNSPDAMCALAEQYLDSRYHRPKRIRALLERAQSLGSARAFYLVAQSYEKGDYLPCESDYLKAMDGYEKAACLGSDEAEKALARLKHSRNGCFEIQSCGLKHKAAVGDVDAMFTLGLMYERSLSPDEEDFTARMWYYEAFRHGRAGAGEALARLARRRTALLREKKASMANEMDDLFREAMKTKPHMVIRQLERAAFWGHTGALMALANQNGCYGEDSSWGYRLTLRCLGKAASQGSAGAFLQLAWIWENGKGMTSNPRMISFFYERAAALGSEYAAWRLEKLSQGDPDRER